MNICAYVNLCFFRSKSVFYFNECVFLLFFFVIYCGCGNNSMRYLQGRNTPKTLRTTVLNKKTKKTKKFFLPDSNILTSPEAD